MTIKIEATEKDIEDILCENMHHYLGLQYIGRQINTPAGIVDILAKSETNNHYIIELKRGAVDPNAYAQVMRYCHYFNYNKSKEGQRVFMPLLIGEHLSQEMVKNVILFEKGGGACPRTPLPEYALFSFNPLSGINFSYHSPAQYEYQKDHLFNDMHFLDKEHDDLLYKNFRLESDLVEALQKIPEGAK